MSKNEQGLNVRLLNSQSQDVKHEDGKLKNKRQDRLSQSFTKTSNFVFRCDVSSFYIHGLFLCFRGYDSLTKKPINATKIGEIPRYKES